MPKLRVGVLMGGKSIEKEVSFNSGRTICDHLDTARYDITPIYQTSAGALYILPWHFLHRGKTTDFEHRLDTEAKPVMWDTLADHVDFMYIAMHGRYAEDGILQGTLELLGIPYLGSSRLASALCMDKTKVKIILENEGITTPKDIVLEIHEAQSIQALHADVLHRLQKKKISLPWVVKPHNEGSSIGVTVVHHEKDLVRAVEKACLVHPQYPQTVLIEEHIHGMEFSCITLVNYTSNTLLSLIPTEIVPESDTEFFDYDQKYMPGRALKYTPPRCSQKIIKKIQDTCMKIMRILDIKTISRIDGFVTKDGTIVIVDPNTFSGMAPSSFVFREAAEMNMSHTQLINHLIETDIRRYGIETKKQNTHKKRDGMQKKKIRVGVLFGGASHEREISLESGRNVVYKMSPDTYEISPLFVDTHNKLYTLTQSQLVRNATTEIAAALKKEQLITWHSLSQRFDFIFNGLHGGAGENGSVQGMLEMLNIPYNGSGVFASALCMDKHKTAAFLKASGFSVPKQRLLHKAAWGKNQKKELTHILDQIAVPCIVKPHDDGCSVLVSRATTEKELIEHITKIFHEKNVVLIEEFLTGMELTVGVLGNETPRALPPSQAIAHAGILSIEEKFLPGAGENQTPAPLPKSALHFVQRTIEQVFKAVGCRGYARIDCFYQTAHESPTSTERVVILEINTLPGLTPATCIFHQAAEIGLKPMDFIDRIIQLGYATHQSTSPLSSRSHKRINQIET